MNPRYRWSGPVGQPPLVELIDNAASRCIATIHCDETGCWHWKRTTSVMLHGAPPTEGTTTRGLPQAKRAVLKGLPD